jgi:hypothetical protein
MSSGMDQALLMLSMGTVGLSGIVAVCLNIAWFGRAYQFFRQINTGTASPPPAPKWGQGAAPPMTPALKCS